MAAAGIAGLQPQAGQPVRGVRDPGGHLVLQAVGGQPRVPAGIAPGQQRAADQAERTGQLGVLLGQRGAAPGWPAGAAAPGRAGRWPPAAPAPAPAPQPGQGLEDLPVDPDPVAQPDPPGGVGDPGSAGRGRRCRATRAPGPARPRAPRPGRPAARSRRPARRVHAAGVGGQVGDQLGDQGSRSGSTTPGARTAAWPSSVISAGMTEPGTSWAGGTVRCRAAAGPAPGRPAAAAVRNSSTRAAC